jgi:hypothetical protein
VGVKQGDLLLKVFLLRLGVGGGKEFFLSGVGCLLHDGRNARAGSGDGGGIKKIFSGKNFRSRFGGMQQRSGYVQRSKFFASEYITFQGGQRRSNTERTIRSTDVAE